MTLIKENIILRTDNAGPVGCSNNWAHECPGWISTMSLESIIFYAYLVLTLFIPEKVKLLVSLPCTLMKCLEAVEIFNAIGLLTSDRCLLMCTLSALDVHPIYWRLHWEQVMWYMMFLKLQIMKLLIANVGRLGSLMEKNVLVTFANVQALQTVCPHLWNTVVLEA